MCADVGHHLDLEGMHQAVALQVPRKAGLCGAGRGIGNKLRLFSGIKRAKRAELIGRRPALIGPGQIERVMRRGHLFERGAIDLVHLRVGAVFLARVDLDRMGHTHAAAKNIADQLE